MLKDEYLKMDPLYNNPTPPPTLFVTGLVLFLSFAILGIWDYYVIKHYGREASITVQISELATNYPIIPLVVGLVLGLVLGHIFWKH